MPAQGLPRALSPGRKQSSVQSTVGLVTGQGVGAPLSHPNLKPQIAALLLLVMQICCK
jgi:hypothetical protein